jgi:hypothetical protein
MLKLVHFTTGAQKPQREFFGVSNGQRAFHLSREIPGTNENVFSVSFVPLW